MHKNGFDIKKGQNKVHTSLHLQTAGLECSSSCCKKNSQTLREHSAYMTPVQRDPH